LNNCTKTEDILLNVAMQYYDWFAFKDTGFQPFITQCYVFEPTC